jgi:CubicO group peptidase (beta-lactamase class C family)
MTKPITGVAILMLQDRGQAQGRRSRLEIPGRVCQSEPPSGKPANLTLTQILTHTSGLGEAAGPAAQQARTLAESRLYTHATKGGLHRLRPLEWP